MFLLQPFDEPLGRYAMGGDIGKQHKGAFGRVARHGRHDVEAIDSVVTLPFFSDGFESRGRSATGPR